MQQMIMENKSWYLQISMVAQTFNLQQTTKVPHTWAFSSDGLELWNFRGFARCVLQSFDVTIGNKWWWCI